MSGLTHEHFARFFHAVWGAEPFPWQEDLLGRLATGKDPRRDLDGDPGVWPPVLAARPPVCPSQELPCATPVFCGMMARILNG